MSAENVRAVLFRTLTDSDFYNLMLVNPGEAVKDYDLTDDERRTLTTPDKDLYKILGGPAFAGLNITFNISLPPPPQISPPAFIPVPPGSPLLAEDEEKIAQLVNSIQNAVGQDRFSKIMQLVQKLQKSE